jgi:hypothetical protein
VALLLLVAVAVAVAVTPRESPQEVCRPGLFRAAAGRAPEVARAQEWARALRWAHARVAHPGTRRWAPAGKLGPTPPSQNSNQKSELTTRPTNA